MYKSCYCTILISKEQLVRLCLTYCRDIFTDIYRYLWIFTRFSEFVPIFCIRTLFREAFCLIKTHHSHIKTVLTLLFSQVCTEPYKTFWLKYAPAKRTLHKHYSIMLFSILKTNVHNWKESINNKHINK